MFEFIKVFLYIFTYLSYLSQSCGSFLLHTDILSYKVKFSFHKLHTDVHFIERQTSSAVDTNTFPVHAMINYSAWITLGVSAVTSPLWRRAGHLRVDSKVCCTTPSRNQTTVWRYMHAHAPNDTFLPCSDSVQLPAVVYYHFSVFLWVMCDDCLKEKHHLLCSQMLREWSWLRGGQNFSSDLS